MQDESHRAASAAGGAGAPPAQPHAAAAGPLRSEIRMGMRIDWDVPVPMDDGIVLRCDVFRPVADGAYPVILSYGPYGKLLHFADGYAAQWSWISDGHPDVLEGSSNTFQNFEVVDPERFVPHGYAVVRFDSRGAGRSPGYLDPWSARETRDLYDCIEWAGRQPWSNGKVGLSGTSYLAMNQWQVATLQPPHLAALCVWEGAVDYYRDMTRHGGILSVFGKHWYGPVVLPVQHGLGRRGFRSRMTGDWVSGPDTLTDEELAANRTDWNAECARHRLATDAFWTSRMPDLSRINVPLLSTANWGGQGLHLRGNVEGFVGAATADKWLDVHCLDHWTEYYTAYGVDLQRRFFDRFLKGEDTGWSRQPRVHMLVRHPGERYVWRDENEWPLARTQWTKLYLDLDGAALRPAPSARSETVTYRGFSDGVTFVTPPLQQETEITGPIAVKLLVSSATEDADLFVVLRVLTPDLREVTFPGHIDPHTPIAQGWLRASHRKLDRARSLPYRPYHAHDEIQKLRPGEIYELDIEVLPTCIVVPTGYRIALSVRGKDYVHPGAAPPTVRTPKAFTGVGLFQHNDGDDRPPAVFDGEVTLHSAPGREPYILLPLIPPKDGGAAQESATAASGQSPPQPGRRRA